MSFHPEEARVPDLLRTDDFLIRPLRTTDVEADYQAVVESREMLRVWDQSDWPDDDFTRKDNRADLEEHEADHEAGTAFTFTVMDPREERCLGCIYIQALRPTLSALGADEAAFSDIGEHDAYVSFWVRASELGSDLERRLLNALLDWFEREWAFGRIALGTNTGDERQRALFRAGGFAETWRFPIAGRDSNYLICTRESKSG